MVVTFCHFVLCCGYTYILIRSSVFLWLFPFFGFFCACSTSGCHPGPCDGASSTWRAWGGGGGTPATGKIIRGWPHPSSDPRKVEPRTMTSPSGGSAPASDSHGPDPEVQGWSQCRLLEARDTMSIVQLCPASGCWPLRLLRPSVWPAY